MGHKIIEFWMLCVVNIFLFQAHKNIWKLIILFYVDFGLRCELFDGNIVLGAPLNLFEFGCRSLLFSQYETSQAN